MKREILLSLILSITYSPYVISQLQVAQTVKIKVNNGGNPDESTGFIIGVEGRKIYIASVGHGKNYLKEGKEDAQVFFYTDDPKDRKSIIPFSGAYIAKLHNRAPYHRDEDLLFLEVQLPTDQIGFTVSPQKTMNLFQIKEKVKKKGAVFSFGHPRNVSTIDNLRRIDTRIEKEKGDNLFTIERKEFKPGFSGAPVYHARTRKLMGMVKSVMTDAECLNITQLKIKAKESGISEDILILDQPNWFLPIKTKWFSCSGIGVSLFALAARIHSDNIYRDYQEDGSSLTPTEFEELHGKSLEEVYNKANQSNQISYVAGAVGIGLLFVAAIDYHKYNKRDSNKSVHMTGSGNTLGLTITF